MTPLRRDFQEAEARFAQPRALILRRQELDDASVEAPRVNAPMP
jgi:hypothetical protein